MDALLRCPARCGPVYLLLPLLNSVDLIYGYPFDGWITRLLLHLLLLIVVYLNTLHVGVVITLLLDATPLVVDVGCCYVGDCCYCSVVTRTVLILTAPYDLRVVVDCDCSRFGVDCPCTLLLAIRVAPLLLLRTI